MKTLISKSFITNIDFYVVAVQFGRMKEIHRKIFHALLKDFRVVTERPDGPDNLPAGLSSFLNRYPQTTRAFVMNQSVEAEVRCGKTRVFFRKIGEVGNFRQLD